MQQPVVSETGSDMQEDLVWGFPAAAPGGGPRWAPRWVSLRDAAPGCGLTWPALSTLPEERPLLLQELNLKSIQYSRVTGRVRDYW